MCYYPLANTRSPFLYAPIPHGRLPADTDMSSLESGVRSQLNLNESL